MAQRTNRTRRLGGSLRDSARAPRIVLVAVVTRRDRSKEMRGQSRSQFLLWDGM